MLTLNLSLISGCIGTMIYSPVIQRSTADYLQPYYDDFLSSYDAWKSVRKPQFIQAEDECDSEYARWFRGSFEEWYEETRKKERRKRRYPPPLPPPPTPPPPPQETSSQVKFDC